MLLRRLLWMLVPVIVSRVLNRRRGGEEHRANKTRYNGKHGR
ncbi:hypothetical protein PTW37_14945 [Arthrobacter agilis]|nr:hypothetical protein [Arthrobacter agilis]WDF33127.1 hypothetical protein PTW37_14945 [Arthrobacter agilis]